jgi:uncharacterized protein (TIGR02246 family)
MTRHTLNKHAMMLLGLILAFSGNVAFAQDQSADKQAIADTLAKYNKALNDSSTAEVMPLYTADGVFMPPYSQSAVGTTQVKTAYDKVFKTITLHVKFTIDEIVQMSPDWAFVRTNSAGTNKFNATGKITAEGNQELFVFKKDTDGTWKIARYSFSPTNPPSKD